jgi:tetratricopeptide (TPR) repeat protein
MAKNKKANEQKGNEFYENPEVLAQQISKTEEFINNNKRIVFSIGGAIALLIVGIFSYKYYVNNLNKEAQAELFQAVYYFEDGDFDIALEGDGNSFGFLKIIEKYGATKAGNLANYYAGVSYYNLSQFDKAIDYLKKFDADDVLIQGRAYSVIGDAYMQLGNFSYAADFYAKASAWQPNKWFTPTYLMKQALALEKQNKWNEAIKCYQRIVDEYHDAREFQDAQKYLARAEVLAKK